MAKKQTTTKTKAGIAKQILIAERHGYYRIVLVPHPDGSECMVGGKIGSRAAAELCREEIIKDLADGTYKADGYSAYAFEMWARLKAFLDTEGCPNSRELAKKLTLQQPWFAQDSEVFRPEDDEEVPF